MGHNVLVAQQVAPTAVDATHEASNSRSYCLEHHWLKKGLFGGDTVEYTATTTCGALATTQAFRSEHVLRRVCLRTLDVDVQQATSNADRAFASTTCIQ